MRVYIYVNARVRTCACGGWGRRVHCGAAHKDIHRWRLRVTSPLPYCIIANTYTLLRKMSETSVKIIKMKKDVGMTPCQKLLKQEGTARWIESMQQSSATLSLHLGNWGLWKIVACSIHLAVPSCFNSFWHGVIPTSFFICNDFYTLYVRTLMM